jgi:O-antigen ligase
VYLLINRKATIFSLPGSIGFICFLIICGVSVFSAFRTIDGLKYWTRLVSLFILYLLAANTIKTEKDMSRFVIALLIGLATPMILGFYQFLAGTGMQDVKGLNRIPFGPRRIFGTFHLPNVYAAYLALPAFVTTTLALDKRLPQIKRFLFGLVACTVSVSLFLTFTRAAWLGVFFGFLYIGIKKYKRLLIVLFVITLLILATFSATELRMGEIQKRQVTASGRLELWKAMLPIAMEKPLMGHGLNNTPMLVKKRTGALNGGQSEYFKALLETGFPGLIALLSIFIPIFWSLTKTLKTCEGSPGEPLMLSLAAYFIASAIIAGFENYTLLEHFFLIPMAVGIGVGRLGQGLNQPIKTKNK